MAANGNKAQEAKETVRKAGAEFAKKQYEKLFEKSEIADNSVSFEMLTAPSLHAIHTSNILLYLTSKLL